MRGSQGKRDGDLLPVTDQVVRDHLTGKHTIGIYPLLKDESCWLLAIDLDKASWQEDAAAFLATCQAQGLPAVLERSRSGNGAHIWFFFETVIPASLARQLGCALITRTMESRPQLGMESYDRLFPSQDTLPKGGFGNLIALPLQAAPRRQGNSVFLDETFAPYSDQWAYLSGIRKLALAETQSAVKQAKRSGRLLGVRLHLEESEAGLLENPWTRSPIWTAALQPGSLPGRVEVIQRDRVYVEKENLPASVIDRLIRIGAFQNPEFYRAQAMRLSTFGKPRIVCCADVFPQHIALPRGCLDGVEEFFESLAVKTSIQDHRFSGAHINGRFCGSLESLQSKARHALLDHDIGVFSAATGFGKTVVAASLIAARGVNTLVLVHRRQLLDQWRDRLDTFLDGVGEIGQIGGGKRNPTGIVDVGMLQSLNRKGQVDKLVADYGFVVVDECHHISAFRFEQVLKSVPARYVLGLTATPIRKDGHHPIIFMQCGPIRFRVDARRQAARRPFDHIVIPRITDFRLPDSESMSIHQVFAALARNESRNDQIFDDLVAAVDQGRSPLFLTERTRHLEEFAERLKPFCRNVVVLKGRMTERQRQQAKDRLASLSDDEERVVLATGRYIGEGFDDARLDALFLAMPISWKGTLQQYVGRLHRVHTEKREVRVYDYVDAKVPVLKRMYERRCKGYRSLGYSLREVAQSKIHDVHPLGLN